MPTLFDFNRDAASKFSLHKQSYIFITFLVVLFSFYFNFVRFVEFADSPGHFLESFIILSGHSST